MKDGETLQETHERLTSRGWTLSVAESCTGGRLSHLLTRMPGASRYYRAGWIVYSPEAKRDLGVPAELLEHDGIVSAATARAMATRARERAGTDFALSTTGNLGPEVLESKPAGLVYIGCAGPQDVTVRELNLPGDREQVREEAARAALALLIDMLEKARVDRTGEAPGGAPEQ